MADTIVHLMDGPCAGHYETALHPSHPPALLTAVTTEDGGSAVLDMPGDRLEYGDVAHEYIFDGPAWACGDDGCESWFVYRHHLSKLVDEQRLAESKRNWDVKRGRAHPRGPGATVVRLPHATPKEVK